MFGTLGRYWSTHQVPNASCAGIPDKEPSTSSSAAQDEEKSRYRQAFSARFKSYQLGEVIPITHDTALFRFLMEDPEDEFNLKPCSTLQVMYKYGVQAADQCQRFYTPVTANGTKGYFDLIVKRKTDGKMTNHLFGMHVGDRLLIRSIGLKVQYRPNRWDHVGMIAGGTGFTPMLQVIRHALGGATEEERGDRTRLSFLYCNRTDKHVLLKGLFDNYAKRFPKRFKVAYAVDNVVDKANWKGYTGYVTHDMIRATMPPPTEKNYVILICGPDKLLNHVAGVPMGAMQPMSSGLAMQPIAADANNLVELGGILGDLGYDNNSVYRF